MVQRRHADQALGLAGQDRARAASGRAHRPGARRSARLRPGAHRSAARRRRIQQRSAEAKARGERWSTSMNVHEYQAKQILRQYGVATPRGIPCLSVAEAEAAARELGGNVWVVKAQIHAGGRGKAGGVKVARSIAEVREHASRILGMTLVTHQTGAAGR